MKRLIYIALIAIVVLAFFVPLTTTAILLTYDALAMAVFGSEGKE